MAHPKRKTSKARRDKRRTHIKLEAKPLAKCDNCDETHVLHRACPACGHYRGRQVLNTGAEA